MGAQFTVFLGKPAMQSHWMAGTAPHKGGVMSRQIKVRQTHTNKYGFAISAIFIYFIHISLYGIHVTKQVKLKIQLEY